MRLEKDDWPDGRCKDCLFSKVVVANGQWAFLGCHHKPFHGRPVSEIRECPKGEEDDRTMPL